MGGGGITYSILLRYSGTCCYLAGGSGRFKPLSLDALDTLRQWPSDNPSERDMAKVPTRINYAENGVVNWGYGIPADTDPSCTVEWFKLLIPDKADFPEYLQNSEPLKEAEATLERLGKDVITVTADYCKSLWSWLAQEARNKCL